MYVENDDREIIRYWMIELGPKGRTTQFYVKARNRYEAIDKTKDLNYFWQIEKLASKKFRLIH